MGKKEEGNNPVEFSERESKYLKEHPILLFSQHKRIELLDSKMQ